MKTMNIGNLGSANVPSAPPVSGDFYVYAIMLGIVLVLAVGLKFLKRTKN